MSSLDFIIHFELDYTNNLLILIAKRNDEDIKIEKLNNQNKKITQITPETRFENLKNLSEDCSLKQIIFTCECEEGLFYRIYMEINPSNIKNNSIENIIKKIRKTIKAIPEETISPIEIKSTKTKISFREDILIQNTINSFLYIEKDDELLEDCGTKIFFTDEIASTENDSQNRKFSLLNTRSAKKNLNDTFGAIITKSDANITEHDRITMIAELRKRSHEDIIELMKKRYHYHTTLYAECQKILENAQ